MQKLCFILFLWVSTFLTFANPLPAHDAFQLSVKQKDPNTFILNWKIAPGYFLYKKRINLSTPPANQAQLGRIYMPNADKKTDRQGRTYSIYRNNLEIPVSILGVAPGETMLTLHFQGCSDAGFCYPPEQRKINLVINEKLALIVAGLDIAPNPAQAHINKQPNEQLSQFALLFTSHNGLFIIISFFGFGLLLAFTPCILPMIPVLSGIIIGHGHQISTRKAFLLSLCYVLSMSLTYSLVGAIFALMGSNLQVIMQSPWAITIFALIFILLALSMFDFYSLQLPLTWQNKFAQITRKQTSGHFLSTALMGCMSILVLSPCVTPPLIGVLSYVAQDGNILLGMVALFFLGLGMGTPLLLIGASAGKLLPKAGVWMNAVKNIFGILFLAVAIYLFSRILPGFIIMCLWASLLVFSGIYLGALRKTNANREKIRQGLGIILLVYGLLILIGASKGNTNPLQPLSNSVQVKPKSVNSLFVVKTLSEAKQTIIEAKGKPILLDFYADWCTSCKIFAATTLQDPQVQAALEPFITIKIDLTPNNTDSRALLNYFHVVAPPTFIFLDKAGQELTDLRTVGEISKDDFLEILKK